MSISLAAPWAAGLCRWSRRQFQHLRQHGLAMGRGHRDRAADRHYRVRIRPRCVGPGKFCGPAPFRRDYRFLAEEGILQVRSDRRDFRPYGLYAAGPASRR